MYNKKLGMKTIIIALLLVSNFAVAQSNYIHDSNFVFSQKASMNYVFINPVLYDRHDTAYSTTITIEKFTDYFYQPLGNGTFTGSGVLYYSVGSIKNEMSINDIGSTDYTEYKKYGLKFLFWKISEFEKLIIQ